MVPHQRPPPVRQQEPTQPLERREAPPRLDGPEPADEVAPGTGAPRITVSPVSEDRISSASPGVTVAIEATGVPPRSRAETDLIS